MTDKPLPKRNHEPKRSTRNFRHRVTLTDYLGAPDAPAMFSSSHRHSEAAPVEGRALRRVWGWGQGVGVCKSHHEFSSPQTTTELRPAARKACTLTHHLATQCRRNRLTALYQYIATTSTSRRFASSIWALE